MRRFLSGLFAKIWLPVLRRRLKTARLEPDDARSSSCLYVFGDSLSDSGNVHRMVGWLHGSTPTPPPYDRGRFSSGPNWVDRLVSELRLVANSAWEGGTNYAHGGAQIGFGLSALTPFPFIPNIGEQVELFAAVRGDLNGSSWVVLFGSHNNLIATAEGRDACSWDEGLGYLSRHLERLYDLGGRKFVVPTLLPLDRTPDAQGDKDRVFAPWIERFNRSLPEVIDAFRSGHSDAWVVSPDLGGLINEILDRPVGYGFANIETPCYDAASGKLAGDPAEYFWWDGCHPTTMVHRYLAERAAETLGQHFCRPGCR